MDLNDKSTFRDENEARIDVRRFRLVIVDSPEPRREGLALGRTWESKLDACSIGNNPRNDFILDHNKVSRFHCEIKIESSGPRIRDLGSLNYTFVDGVRVDSAFLRHGSIVRVGPVSLRFELLNKSNRLPHYDRNEFGGMVSSSYAMRSCFALMQLAAGSCDATVLLEGETGTGKTTAAKAIHQASARRKGEFLTVDCGAVAANLIEDDLFGHEKGGFTGANSRRPGVFEAAAGGTVFLDEIGELHPDLQPKLLRVIEDREVRPLGSNTPIQVDVRIIAATHKDLRVQMMAGRFRPDLFYRIDVLKMRLPSLRERPEDMPLLVDRMLEQLGASPEVKALLSTTEYIAALKRAAWPGNIRELRNHLERCKLHRDTLPVEGTSLEGAGFTPDASQPMREEKERAVRAFERAYLEELMRLHHGNVTKAAATAGIERESLHRQLKKHGIRGE